MIFKTYKFCVIWSIKDTYGQVQIKCDEMPKNEVSQFMENVCPFCAAEFVDPKNVMVIYYFHILVLEIKLIEV